ncbi:MAG: ADP-ribosylglycohydrolase family protein [Neglectibacter sp.]
MESENFEDTIRIAVSLGGDSDTIAAIAKRDRGSLLRRPERP